MARILVIDDEPKVRQTVCRMLTLADHTVVEAEDGDAGLAQLRKEKPAVVVTDILMPGMEGIETILALRRLSPGIKIVATSGGGNAYESTDLLSMALKLGADAVLPKPFRAAELVQTIERLLAG